MQSASDVHVHRDREERKMDNVICCNEPEGSIGLSSMRIQRIKPGCAYSKKNCSGRPDVSAGVCNQQVPSAASAVIALLNSFCTCLLSERERERERERE